MRNFVRSHYQFTRPKLFGFNSWEKRNWGDDEETTTTTSTPTPVMAPEYPEAEAARGKWWETLQDWGEQPGYGIIEPNYENIYKNAQKRLSEHYYGGPLSGGGVMGKVASDLARRNVSDSPAASVMRGRVGAQMANDLSNVSTQQDIARATAAEQARMGWLGSMQNLSAMKPNVAWGSTTTQTQPGTSIWDTIGGIGGSLLSLANPYGGWMGGLSSAIQPRQTQSSIRGYPEIGFGMNYSPINATPWY